MSSIHNAISIPYYCDNNTISSIMMKRPAFMEIDRFLYEVFGLTQDIGRLTDSADLNIYILPYRRALTDSMKLDLSDCILDTSCITSDHVDTDHLTLTLPAKAFELKRFIAVHVPFDSNADDNWTPIRWFAFIPSSQQPGTLVPVEFLFANDVFDPTRKSEPPLVALIRLQDIEYGIRIDAGTTKVLNRYATHYNDPNQWPGMVERFMNQCQQQARSWNGIVN
jgi:hypothetical protein